MEGEVLRAVVISLGHGAGPPPFFAGRFEGIDVRSTSLVTLGPDDVGIVAVARSATDLPVEDGCLALPGDLIAGQDMALETVARMMAVDRQTSYLVRAPFPYLGFFSDNLEALDDLKVDVPVTTGRQVPVVQCGLTAMDASVIHDRLAGLGYLAEALNASTPIGEYLQLVRLFESAFCIPVEKVLNRLARFLVGTRFNFTHEEVKEWLDARGSSAHADNAMRRYYLSRDVAPYVGRMLEAGYDLLLNKESWGTDDPARRDQWIPAYGSAGTGVETFATQGHGVELGVRISDMFEAFAVVMNPGWPEVLPRAAWLEGGAKGGRTRVLGEWTG